MASSAFEICNMALCQIRKQPMPDSISATWQSAPSEEISRRCSLLYDQVRQKTLREHPWKFAGAHVVLQEWTALAWHVGHAFVAGNFTYNDDYHYCCILAHTAGATDEPGTGANWETYWELLDPFLNWDYYYQMPDDCLNVRRVFGETNTKDEGEPFEKAMSPYLDENVILCNVDDARAEITADVEDVDLFDPTFTEALVYNLASALVGVLTGDVGLEKLMAQKAMVYISEAKSTNQSESKNSVEASSRYVDARG